MLPHIVRTRSSTSGFTSLLNGWQKKTDKNTNNGNNNKKFNQRKAAISTSSWLKRMSSV
jgi:hypothetical protein